MGAVLLQDALDRAPDPLRFGLQWFLDRTGQVIGWPNAPAGAPVSYLATKAKGIYKPSGSSYALSIRQGLDSPYADRDVTVRPDGSWLMAYNEENPAVDKDTLFTNAALLRNMTDGVPVAVFQQVSKSPSRYRVRGLAMVVSYFEGFYYLEGFSNQGVAAASFTDTQAEVAFPELATGSPDLYLVGANGQPITIETDARKWVQASVVRRAGQGKFRSDLLNAYVGRCAVTGCAVTQVLDAAHIQPYKGEHTNKLTNGLLLRADVHNLFDLGLLAVVPEEREIVLAPELRSSEYSSLHRTPLGEPLKKEWRASDEALNAHLQWCREIVQPDAA